jgi:hypothetical protein
MCSVTPSRNSAVPLLSLERLERRLRPVAELLVLWHARVRRGLPRFTPPNLSPHHPSQRYLLRHWGGQPW